MHVKEGFSSAVACFHCTEPIAQPTLSPSQAHCLHRWHDRHLQSSRLRMLNQLAILRWSLCLQARVWSAWRRWSDRRRSNDLHCSTTTSTSCPPSPDVTPDGDDAELPSASPLSPLVEPAAEPHPPNDHYSPCEVCSMWWRGAEWSLVCVCVCRWARTRLSW